MGGLVALDFGPSDDFVAALATVWDEGHAALPVDQRLPAPARARLFETMKPTEPWNAGARSPTRRRDRRRARRRPGGCDQRDHRRAKGCGADDALRASRSHDHQRCTRAFHRRGPTAVVPSSRPHGGSIDRHQITADRRCDHRPPPLRASGCRGGCQPGGHGRLAGSSRPR